MERLLPKLLGGWALLNTLLVAAAAVLAFLRHPMIFEPQGIGPDRIAIAALFTPYEAQAWAFLLVIALMMAIVGFGLIRRKRWARILLIVALIGAMLATLPALIWGATSGSPAVAVGGALKIAIYLVFALALNTNFAKRSLDQ